MAHLLQNLKDYFVLDEINIDNWTFKLFYKVSCALCMMGATIGVATQYFGDPISCEFQGINSDLAQDYCWIHGSSYIPPQYQASLKCIVSQEGVTSRDNAPDTAFYQWVTFMMAAQAALFYLPYKIWSSLEGGLIASFGTDAKTPVIISADARYDDGVVMEAVVEKFVKYFKSIFHHNSWYFGYFIACEFLNYLLLGVQFFLTDMFLNYKFSWYGWDTIAYYNHPYIDRVSMSGGLRNPMCGVFPTEVSCNIPNIGAAGEAQSHNGLCVLTQNIINEKIYLVLWFWYAFLVPYSVLSLFYRVFTLFFESIRFGLIYKAIRHKYDKDIHKCLTYVLSKAQLGDWFVLYQLSKNCNPYFYREFVKELAIELKHRPKKSKALSSKTSLENGLMSPMFTTYNPQPQDQPNVISLDRDLEKEEIQV